MSRHSFILTVPIIFILFLNSCTENSTPASTTVIINPGSSRGGTTSYMYTSRAPAGISSLLLKVTGPDMITLEKNYSASQTAISLDLAAGPSRVFTLDALDSGNNIVYTGASQPVDLVAGETIDITIIMDYASWGKIYVSNWSDDTVSVIDGKTNTVVDTITVGNGPGGVGVNTATGKVYVTNDQGGSVSVINSATDTVTGAIDIGITSGTLEPFFAGVNPILNEIYVSVYWSGGDDVIFINGATDGITTTVAHTTAGSYTYGIGVNTNNNRIYVATWGSIAIFDGTTDSYIGTVSGIAGNESRGVTVNPDTNRVYVTDVDADYVSVIDGSTDAQITTVAIGTGPYDICVNTATNKIYAVNNTDGTVSVINGSTNTVITTIPVGTSPMGICVNEITNRVYVANSDAASNSVSVIDGSADTVVTTIPVGTNPAMIDIMP